MLSLYMSSSTNYTNITSDIPVGIQCIVGSLILAFACSGNCFLILSCMKKKKKSMSCKSIMNLALCDLMLVVSSIPTQIVEMQYGYFPFGAFGCHVLHPFSTMAVISAALTLVYLAFERYVAICHPFLYYKIANKSQLLILTHLTALSCVIPYGVTLSVRLDNGKPQCIESWNKRSSFIYSITLFAVQYGLPLPIICFLYFFTWRKLKETNDEYVRRTQRLYNSVRFSLSNNRCSLSNNRYSLSKDRDIKLKISYRELQTRNSLSKDKCFLVKENQQEQINRRNAIKNRSIKKWKVSNDRCRDVCRSRRMQTLLMFRLFVTIVIVFGLFMLPNQITWLYMAFLEKTFTNKWTTIAYWLTYTNSVLNPIIYGTNQNFYKFVNFIKTIKHLGNKTKEQIPYEIKPTSIVNNNFVFRRHISYRQTVFPPMS
ncbi:alpha-1A adrenergic receptor [Hydra vulgaris]|uniref:alpha-1A adrenergic receptor n=1 Tax=Hydra vulgaris TaxID=6087 RepID=UPI0002B492C6|nr:alpha-1A adrenergic receptor-like [Hydra vulgaris]